MVLYISKQNIRVSNNERKRLDITMYVIHNTIRNDINANDDENAGDSSNTSQVIKASVFLADIKDFEVQILKYLVEFSMKITMR